MKWRLGCPVGHNLFLHEGNAVDEEVETRLNLPKDNRIVDAAGPDVYISAVKDKAGLEGVGYRLPLILGRDRDRPGVLRRIGDTHLYRILFTGIRHRELQRDGEFIGFIGLQQAGNTKGVACGMPAFCGLGIKPIADTFAAVRTGFLYKCLLRIGFRALPHFLKAVSYTHLDVYKRQLQGYLQAPVISPVKGYTHLYI